jgi:hypothetical protein
MDGEEQNGPKRRQTRRLGPLPPPPSHHHLDASKGPRTGPKRRFVVWALGVNCVSRPPVCVRRVMVGGIDENGPFFNFFAFFKY